MKSNILRCNTLLNPIAQSARLCEPVYNLMTTGNSVVDNILTDRNIHPLVKLTTELMFLYGLRIGEILTVAPNQIFPDGSILIKGEKGSNDRIIRSVMFSPQWLNDNKYLLPINTYFNRFYFYRLFSKYGITTFNGVGKKTSVTHSLRNNKISELDHNNIEIETIQQFIGHKSIKSTQYYVNKSKQRRKA